MFLSPEQEAALQLLQRAIRLSEGEFALLLDRLEHAPAGTRAASVSDLDTTSHLHEILAIWNNGREEFRKRLPLLP